MNIYAGNLSKDVTEEDLRVAFRAFGQVAFVNIVRDRFRISKGFGILEMPEMQEAEAAIAGLHSKELKGRPITVKGAQARSLSVSENVSPVSSPAPEVTP